MIKIMEVIGVLVIMGVTLIFTYSQIILPLAKKTPFFPIFRRRPNIESKIEVANEKLAEKNLQCELEEKKMEVRSKTNINTTKRRQNHERK